MGKRKRDRQPRMWGTTTDLPTAASHPFYRRLNELLRQHGFDNFAEAQCATSAPTWRTVRAAVCTSIRDRRAPTHPCPRTQERAEAAARACERVQSGSDDAHALQDRHPTRAPGSHGCPSAGARHVVESRLRPVGADLKADPIETVPHLAGERLDGVCVKT